MTHALKIYLHVILIDEVAFILRQCLILRVRWLISLVLLEARVSAVEQGMLEPLLLSVLRPDIDLAYAPFRWWTVLPTRGHIDIQLWTRRT